MLEILIYSISKNTLVMDTVVAVANFLSAGGLSVVVREDPKKNGFDYKEVKNCDQRGVFRLNDVNYYSKDAKIEETEDPDVIIWDAGNINVLYEMKKNVTGYMCVDAYVDQPEDVSSFFDEIEVKTEVLLFNGSKNTLQRYHSQGVRCIQLQNIEDGVCPYELSERIKNALVLKGLPLPKPNDREFATLILKKDGDTTTTKSKKGKKAEKKGFFGKKTKKKEQFYDGEYTDDDEDFDWTTDVYAKPLETETLPREDEDSLENLIIAEEEDENEPNDHQKNNDLTFAATHKAFMPNDIPEPDMGTPSIHDIQTTHHTDAPRTKGSSEIEHFDNIPKPETPPMYDDPQAIHKPAESMIHKGQPILPETKNEEDGHGDEVDTEDDKPEQYAGNASKEKKLFHRSAKRQKSDASEDDEEEYESYEEDDEYEGNEDEGDTPVNTRRRPGQKVKSPAGFRDVMNFLEEKMDNSSRKKEKKKDLPGKVKFMGRMSICVLDLYRGCGSSYISGSLASVMAQAYGKNTYIVRDVTTATPDSKKIKEVTQKEEFRKIERNAVIIYDRGVSDLANENIIQMAESCDARVLVCSGTEEGISILARHVHQFKDEAKEWIYVFNNVQNKKQQKRIMELMHQYDIIFTPPHDFSNPPKQIITQWQKCFRKILSGV